MIGVERVVQTPPLPPGTVDPNFLISQLFPLIGAVAALIVGGVVLYAFFKSDLAAAIAERIRSKIHRAPDDDRVAELEQRLGELQGQLSELAERVDFAERLLAQNRERALPGA